MFKNYSLPIIISLLILPLSVFAQPLTYSDSVDHYSFVLPSDWIEIPKNVIDQVMDELVRQTQGQSISYVAGFQLDSENYFSYPYILVQKHKINTPSYSEVEKMFNGVGTDKTIDKTVKEYNEILKSANVGSPLIDRDRNIIFMNMDLDVVNIGVIKGLTAMFLGKEGITQLNFYTVESEYSRWLPVFSSIIDSFSYDAGYIYSPAEAKKYDSSFNFGSILEKGISGAIIGGIIGLVIHLISRSKKKKDKSE